MPQLTRALEQQSLNVVPRLENSMNKLLSDRKKKNYVYICMYIREKCGGKKGSSWAPKYTADCDRERSPDRSGFIVVVVVYMCLCVCKLFKKGERGRAPFNLQLRRKALKRRFHAQYLFHVTKENNNKDPCSRSKVYRRLCLCWTSPSFYLHFSFPFCVGVFCP